MQNLKAFLKHETTRSTILLSWNCTLDYCLIKLKITSWLYFCSLSYVIEVFINPLLKKAFQRAFWYVYHEVIYFFLTLTYMMTNEALQKRWKLRIIDEKYMFMDEKLNNEK